MSFRWISGKTQKQSYDEKFSHFLCVRNDLSSLDVLGTRFYRFVIVIFVFEDLSNCLGCCSLCFLLQLGNRDTALLFYYFPFSGIHTFMFIMILTVTTKNLDGHIIFYPGLFFD